MGKRKLIFGIFIAIFAAIFLFSLYQLTSYFTQVEEAQSEYADLIQLVEDARPSQPATPATEPDASEPDVAVTEPALVEVTGTDGVSRLILPEYKPIYELNNDLVGWICIDGTNINFPVVYHPQLRDYYLYRDFYRNSSSSGAIYVREECDPFTPSDNVVIYGHRMQAGTMFAKLHEYKDPAFWQAHRYIQFDSLTEHRYFEILAVFTIDSTPDSDFPYHTFVDAADEAEFDTFIAQCKAYALYETGVTAQYGDKLITLSTCNGPIGGIGRLVVVAKLVTE